MATYYKVKCTYAGSSSTVAFRNSSGTEIGRISKGAEAWAYAECTYNNTKYYLSSNASSLYNGNLWIKIIYNGTEGYTCMWNGAGYSSGLARMWDLIMPNGTVTYNMDYAEQKTDYTTTTYYYYKLNAAKNGYDYDTYQSVRSDVGVTIRSYSGYVPDNTSSTGSRTITFNKNDGSNSSTTEDFDTSITTSYKFKGWWYTTSAVSSLYPIGNNIDWSAGSYTTQQSSSGIIYLYPIFETNTTTTSLSNFNKSTNYPSWTISSTTSYTVNFYEDTTGSWAVAQTKSASIVKTKDFLGWSTTATGNVITSNTTLYSTLYAKWGDEYTSTNTTKITLPAPKNTKSSESNIFTASFSMDGGNAQNNKTAGTRTYSFSGWTLNGTSCGTTGAEYQLTSTTTNLYASWSSSASAGDITLPTPTKNTVNGTGYSITIDPKNGTSAITTTIYVGRKEYTFDAWYKDSTFKTKAGNAGATYSLASTQTLYAKWIETATDGAPIQDPTYADTVTDITTTLNTNCETINDYSLTSKKTVKHAFAGWYNGSTKVTSTNPYVPTANATLTAKWTNTTSYTQIDLADLERVETENVAVTLDYNYSGSTNGSKTVVKTVPYTFNGWFTAASGGTNVDSGNTKKYKPTSNGTIYAQWSEGKSTTNNVSLPSSPTRTGIAGTTYTINYNGNNGTPAKSSETVIRGKTTYTFKGWYTASSGGTKVSNTYTTSTPVTLYAQWTTTNTNQTATLSTITRNNVDSTLATVNLDLDGGTVTGSDPITVNIGGIRYTFKGWYTATSGGTKYGDAEATYTPSGSTTTINMYAQWTEDKDTGKITLPTPTKATYNGRTYTVKLVKNNGEADSTTTITIGKITYTFAGWYKNMALSQYAGDAGASYTVTTESQTIYAKWAETEESDSNILRLPAVTKAIVAGTKYTVTLVQNNGADNDVRTITVGKKTYALAGWYKDSEFSSFAGNGNEDFYINNSYTLYAKFTETITNEKLLLPSPTKATVNGSTFSVTLKPENGEAEETKSVIVGKEEYTFDAWYKDSAFKTKFGDGGSEYSISATQSLYAKFNVNRTDGINIATPTTKSNDTETIITTINYGYDIDDDERESTKTIYYAFDGWYNGSTKVTSVTPYKPTSNCTLTAKWKVSNTTYSKISLSNLRTRQERDEIPLRLNSNFAPWNVQTSYATRTITYDFEGWFNRSSGGSNIDPDGTNRYEPKADGTIYAQWSEYNRSVNSINLYPITRDRINGTTYTIKYNGNNGSPERSTDTVIRGRTEYTFDGWYDAATGGNRIPDSYTLDANNPITDVYAHWSSEYINEDINLPNANRNNTSSTSVSVYLESNGGILSDYSLSTSIGGIRYAFKGWYSDSNTSNLIGLYGETYIPSGSTTTINMYAGWNTETDDGTVVLPDNPTKPTVQGNTYTLTLKNNNGTADTKKTVTVGKCEYTFAGWYKDRYFGTPVTLTSDGRYAVTNSHTIYAKWTEKATNDDQNFSLPAITKAGIAGTKFTVTIDNANGSANTTKDIYSGRTEYDLVGWYSDQAYSNSNFLGSANTNYFIDATRTIYAKWNTTTYDGSMDLPSITKDMIPGTIYNVTLHPNNGSSNTVKQAIIGQTKYELEGWYKDDPNTLIGLPGAKYTITSTQTIHAKWKSINTNPSISLDEDIERQTEPGRVYTIYYNGNTGTVDKSTEIIIIGRREYEFKGWFLAETGGQPIGFTYTPSKDNVHLYAQYDVTATDQKAVLPGGSKTSKSGNSITVELNANGGNVQTNKLYTTIGGKKYELDGWYSAESGGSKYGVEGQEFEPDNNSGSGIDMYAHWKEIPDDGYVDLPTPTRSNRIEYNVTLDAGIGTIDGVNRKNVVASTGIDYSFNGWHEPSGKLVEMHYQPQEGITLTAYWTAESSNDTPIELNIPESKYVFDLIINLYNNKTDTDNTKTIKTANKIVSREFKGWFLDGSRIDSGVATSYMPNKNNITITAEWGNPICEPILIDDISRDNVTATYNVTLNPNGGLMNGPTTITAIKNTSYIFLGWFDARIGMNKLAVDGIYNPDPNSDAEVINMYAHWKSSGRNTPASLSIPSKNGYKFVGWSTSNTSIALVDNPYMPSANTPLYAVWEFRGKIIIGSAKYIPYVWTTKWNKLLTHIHNGTEFKPVDN